MSGMRWACGPSGTAVGRSAARAFALIAMLAGQATCVEPSPKGPSTSLATHPRAADRLARLMRKQLTDTNPVAIERLLSCEGSRLARALVRDLGDPAGLEEFQRRTAGVRDSMYRSRGDRERIEIVRDQLAGGMYEVGGPLCDSVNAIADREDPIIPMRPAPDSGARRP